MNMLHRNCSNACSCPEILCTLGPSSMNDRVIARLEELGVSLFRINLSHTHINDVYEVIQFLKARTSVPICLDTEGAQIRTGDLFDTNIALQENSIVSIPSHVVPGDSNSFNLYPIDIVDKILIGDFISIGFSSVLAQAIDKDSSSIKIRIWTGGLIGKNKAVSIDRDIDLPPLTKKDQEALAIGAKMGIRHVALSFVNRASDIDEIHSISGKDVFVISKIESIKGVINLEEIAAKSNALLLDRGDLSRVIPIERIPRLQKDIVSRAKKSNVKIYVATNLLESMVTVPTPTRAEVNDIFNILNDGADGLVLAAETAIGSYPISCTAMLVKIIKQFMSFPNGYSLEELRRKDSFLLVEPHGGVLVNRVRDDVDAQEIKSCKTLKVDKAVLLDAEQIALGTFSPLEGFMNKKEVESVLKDYKLPNGVVWPIPIVLQTIDKEASRLKIGDRVALALEDSNEVYCILHLEDIYDYDLDKMSMEVFGTNDPAHPGVQFLKRRGNYFLGGKIDLIKYLPSSHKNFEITPRQARAIFENKGWSRVVGFHTRNVIHRVHEHIQMLAFDKYNCDGIFVHPVVGPKKQGDYAADIILKSYEKMLHKHYPQGKVVLGAFKNYSRYSGSREAVFTALCRKNFGCSHFIVGRDHTGVADYYKHDDAHKLFSYLGDIGITPIFFNAMHYCKECRTYVEQCSHDDSSILSISGSEGRRFLKEKKSPPDWFMRGDISRLVLDEMEKGKKVFL